MNTNYLDTPLWNSGLAEEKRLDYLMDALTLEEKFACLGTGCPAIERLGIPNFGVGGEGAHGVQARHDQMYDRGEAIETTIFPNPVGMSATWDRVLIKEAGTVVGNEARALYEAGLHRNLSLWAPTVDMERDPRWGRTEEGYGEDPYLAGEMAGAYVDGMQGEHPYYLRCGATLKHFYANNVEEGRTYLSSSVDLRNKHEYYLEPFRKVIQEHHVEGMMTAYNEVNGIPCMLLGEDIRLAKSWGLRHVVCDGGDVNQTVNFHKYFHRHSETIAAGLKADIDCFTDDIKMVSEAAREAYEHKMITEEEIDKALRNHFGVMLRLGLFDRDGRNPYAKIGLDEVSCKKNQKIARKMTAESVILLKNEGILPLKIKDSKQKLAVIGPLSDVWYKDWYSGIPPYAVTPLEGVKRALAGVDENTAEGENTTEDGNTRCASSKAQVFDMVLPEECIANGKSKVQICLSTCVEKTNENQMVYKYLGIMEDGQTIGAVPQEKAETFELSDWGDGKVTLRSLSNGLFLTVEDDETKNETGRVIASKREEFGWFVKEIFYLVDGALCTWDKKALVVGRDNGIYKTEIYQKRIDRPDCNKSDVDMLETNSLQITVDIVEDGIAKAVLAAQKADTAIVYLGAHPMITCKEEIDREHIALPDFQRELLKRVCEVNANVILVMISSVPYDISWAQNGKNVRAILLTASGSMELGNGITDILTGKESPAGRLNMTWYQSLEGFPLINDYDIIQKGRTYQYYDGKVLYPFGFGLTYSEMKYENLQAKLKDYIKLVVTVDVTNTGEYVSDEVVQLYVHKKDSVVKRPYRTLKGFERVKDMQPLEKRSIAFEVALEDLKYFDVITEEKLLEPGEYEIMAGCSCEDIRQCVTVALDGTKRSKRNGFQTNKAECFDRAKHFVLRSGHLGYTSICTKNGTDKITLTYEKMYLEKKAKSIILDFWLEHACDICVEADGRRIGSVQVSSPTQEESQQLEAGQANGSGAFESHQNWITKRREVGFTEVTVPLSDVPCDCEFTLTISWQGMGKMCTYRFA